MSSGLELSLDELLDAVGGGSLRVLNPTAALTATVSAVVVADVHSLDRVPAGALALVPGVSVGDRDLGSLAQHAAAAGASAIALRAAGDGSPAVDVGVEAALAIIGVVESLEWGELYEMLTTILKAPAAALPFLSTSPALAPLFVFADAAAVAMGGAVSIEDPQGRMLAYSNVEGQSIDRQREEVILARRVPLTQRNRAEYVALAETAGPLRFPALKGELPRLAIAVRVGDQILGFLWVIEDELPGDDIDRRVIETARLAAVALLRARAADDIRRRTRDDALRRLLTGEWQPGLLSTTGLRRGAAVGVLAARVPSDVANDDPAPNWLTDLLALTARVRFKDVHCLQLDNVIYAVIATAADRLPELSELSRTVLDRLAGRVVLQIGIGTDTQIEHLARARRDADRALAALAARGAGPSVAGLDEVRSLAVLTELAELTIERPTLLGELAQRIRDGDGRTPPWTLQMLHAYFECQGNINAAAAAIHIHPNTFRYRFNRIVRQFELKLEDPDERLVLALELRIIALTGADR